MLSGHVLEMPGVHTIWIKKIYFGKFGVIRVQNSTKEHVNLKFF